LPSCFLRRHPFFAAVALRAMVVRHWYIAAGTAAES
jgi:hypothetical protein